ncbi:MAG: NAD(P)-dependent oxidoreductase [Alicyclobacillus sp.]|nr:NAD(P)-dependent oxidoreductase [Alicyclobacillus sp.]
MSERLGFIGLGNMGHHMANRLLEHGYLLALFDIRYEALEPFQGLPGVTIATSPAEVTQFADTILVSLPSLGAVRDVALGDNGLCSGKPFKTYIDVSTIGCTVAREIAAVLQQRGTDVLDAPVSGGVLGAKHGTLAIMVSGDRSVYERHRPILEVIGKNVFYVGSEVGQAQVMKLANNYLSAVAMAATSEAIVLGVKAGLDPNVMLHVLNVSSGRNSATLEKFPRSVLSRKFDYGFKTGLTYKDVDLCLTEAERLGATMWVGSIIRELWRFSSQQLGPDSDQTDIVRLYEEWANVTVADSDDV